MSQGSYLARKPSKRSRNVGMPLSADVPAPEKIATCRASRKHCRMELDQPTNSTLRIQQSIGLYCQYRTRNGEKDFLSDAAQK